MENPPLTLKNLSRTTIVININPLRYNYYLNDQLISQFFDNNDIELGKFTKDTANLPLNEIEVLQIFNPDTSENNSQKQNLQNSKKVIQNYQDSVSINNAKRYYTEKYLEPIIDEPDWETPKLTAKKEYKKQQPQIDSAALVRDKLDRELENYTRMSENEFGNYLSILESLTINNDSRNILNDIIKRNTDISGKSLHYIEDNISDAANNTISNLKSVDELLGILPDILSSLVDSPNVKNDFRALGKISDLDQAMKPIKVFASNKAFAIDESQFRSQYQDNYIKEKLEIFKVEEFADNEKIKLAEAFVLFASLQIGKLLQNEVINNSRFQNQLNDETCLCDKQNEINEFRDHDSTIYQYIQDISASLNVLINYLELNNPAFNSTVNSVNTNYKSLLKFLKTLDYVTVNNTKEFTLPAHNNYKNVDLIRYSVERSDRLRGRNEPYTYDLWIKGGVKIDFSVAILMSQLKDFSYSKDPYFVKSTSSDSTGAFPVIQNTDSFFIKKVDNGKYNFSFGGMVNVLWRTGASWITPGASIGIAYGPATNSKLQFLGALSLQFGKSERIIAHFGVVAGEAQRLDLSKLSYDPKAPNDNGASYLVRGDFVNGGIETIPTFVFKPFFGISYNLSKKNALNAVGSQADAYKNAYPQVGQ
ncbi:MAG TPA: hypothetical protein VIJ75_11235 [Hanamia sp.]